MGEDAEAGAAAGSHTAEARNKAAPGAPPPQCDASVADSKVGDDPAADAPVSIPRIVRKLNLRIMPLLSLGALVNLLTRTNVAFSSKSLAVDINLNPQTYGLGTGVFNLTYALMQYPANYCLLRLGAPTWLCLMTAAWSICSACLAAVRNAQQFALVMALLGIAQAGYLPGAW